jgi:hypothetical protein
MFMVMFVLDLVISVIALCGFPAGFRKNVRNPSLLRIT